MYKIGIKNYKGVIRDPELTSDGDIRFQTDARGKCIVLAELPRWLNKLINKEISDAYDRGRDQKTEEIKNVLEVK